MDNLFRIKCGIHHFRVPHDYETNTKNFTAWTGQGGNFREESLPLAQDHLRELMGHIATHYYRKNDMVNAAIYAMALRQLSPKGWSGPWPFDPHNPLLHGELNNLFGMEPPTYLYQACDSLLKMVKDELARHGIVKQTLWTMSDLSAVPVPAAGPVECLGCGRSPSSIMRIARRARPRWRRSREAGGENKLAYGLSAPRAATHHDRVAARLSKIKCAQALT